MILSELPQSVVGREKNLGYGFCEGVKSQIEGPVEHLDQEWPLGQYSRVPIVGEARRVGCLNDHAAQVSFLGRVL